MKIKKFSFVLFFLLNIHVLIGQNPTKPNPSPDEIIKSYGFQKYRIEKNGDFIEFYVHNPDNKPKENLAVFLSGSDPRPTFTYEIKDGKFQHYLWGHKDFKLFPENYAFVLIAKRGMEGVMDDAAANKVPAVYLEKNSLDYRVWQTDEVINYCVRNVLISKPHNIVIYGHSEGFNVAAKLVTVNKKITHAGLFAGSAMPDYFDFMIFRSKELSRGEIDDAKFKEELEKMQSNYKEVFKNPTDIKSEGMYTNKRWASYAEPPVNYLVKATIPLYMIVSTRDENAPIESSYIVPLEFIRLGKTNLTYKMCSGCDHNFYITDKDGKKSSTWDQQIKDFVDWIDKTPAPTKK